ncbi:peamaclein-like [Salvia hispanica]|uniref:peamaclein-like n=1 Tax=Salvia hispanica TaxID=49212 RepID=UPI00200927D2|nr:peamaclein-like [Salvia hispanica]
MKPCFATFLVVALILSSNFLESMATTDSSFCGEKCGVRCSKAGLKKRCLKYCGICCEECKCVPSGTYGNKSECPCYRDKLNSKGNPKCP